MSTLIRTSNLARSCYSSLRGQARSALRRYCPLLRLQKMQTLVALPPYVTARISLPTGRGNLRFSSILAKNGGKTLLNRNILIYTSLIWPILGSVKCVSRFDAPRCAYRSSLVTTIKTILVQRIPLFFVYGGNAAPIFFVPASHSRDVCA